MRNLKKIFAVLVVVALMASMMVPALAAGFTYEDQATKLNNIKLMEGMNLGDKVTRIQALTFAIKAAGKNAEAQALTDAEVAEILANVVDADKVPTWGKKYLAWAVKNGKTAGVDASIAPKVKFVADGAVDAKVFLFWTLTIGMGYQGIGTGTATSKAVDAKVISVTQAVDFNLKGELIRDDVAGILYGAAMTGVNADGKGFMASLISAGFVTQQLASDNGFAAAPAPVALGATATSLNTKQIQVVFNKEVNKDDAQKTSFYEVKKDSTTYAISSAAIAADNKTVTLTLAEHATIQNNVTVKVTVKKDLKDAAGTKLAADIANDVAVGDATFPTFDKVESKGEKTLRLTFSEPVQIPNGGADFTVKAGSYTWTVVSATANIKDHTVDLQLGTALIEGTVNVTVKNTVKDYANLMVFEKTIAYAYAKDTTAPVASITKSEPAKVVVKFDRPVYGNVKVSHSIKDNATYTLSETVAVGAAKDEWTFDYTGAKLPAGNVNIFVFMGDETNNPIKDLYGNKYVAQSFTVTVVADTAAPAVSETKLNDKTSYQVIFDEAVQPGEVKIANYTLAKADGTAALFSISLGNSNKTVTITPAGGFADNTTYNLTIKKVKDVEGNTNAADIVLNFTTGDNTAPEVKKDTFAVNADGKIYIYFSEAMNQAAMLSKANYMVSTDGAAAYVALGDDDTVTAISDKVVLIDLKSAVSTPDVMISVAVTDLAGKKLTTADLAYFTTAVAELATGIPAETLYVEKAEAIAKNKIKVTFTRELSQFDSADLIISDSTNVATVVAISAVESVSGKEVVITLASDLTTNAKHTGTTNTISVSAINAPANTKSQYGTKLTTPSTVVVADKAVAEVTKSGDNFNVNSTIPTVGGVESVVVTKNTTGTIQILFSEPMDRNSISTLSFTVAGYSVTGVDYANGDATVVLEVKCNADNTTYIPVVTQQYSIKDVAGNVLNSGTSWSSKR